MERYYIQDWNSGTFQLQLPTSVKYVEIYDYDDNFITDSYSVVINDFNILRLDYENFKNYAFPLKAVVFDRNDASGGEALFDLSSGLPVNDYKIAIGKRHATAKDVVFSEFQGYINSVGNAAISKQFNGFDYAAGRTNLNLLSTQETKEKLSGVLSYEEKYYNYSEGFDGGPFLDDTTYPFQSTKCYFRTTVREGIVTINSDFTTLGQKIYWRNSDTHGIFRVCSIAEATGNSNFAPLSALFVMPVAGTLPITGYYRFYPGGLSSSFTYFSYSDMPLMVVTGGSPFTMNEDTELLANSVYFINPYWERRYGSTYAYLDFDNLQHLKYEITYALSDDALKTVYKEE